MRKRRRRLLPRRPPATNRATTTGRPILRLPIVGPSWLPPPSRSRCRDLRYRRVRRGPRGVGRTRRIRARVVPRRGAARDREDRRGARYHRLSPPSLEATPEPREETPMQPSVDFTPSGFGGDEAPSATLGGVMSAPCPRSGTSRRWPSRRCHAIMPTFPRRPPRRRHSPRRSTCSMPASAPRPERCSRA